MGELARAKATGFATGYWGKQVYSRGNISESKVKEHSNGGKTKKTAIKAGVMSSKRRSRVRRGLFLARKFI